jgi:hypothetical protein
VKYSQGQVSTGKVQLGIADIYKQEINTSRWFSVACENKKEVLKEFSVIPFAARHHIRIDKIDP